MSRQAASGFPDDGYGVASASRRDVQMQVQAFPVATELEEPREGSIVLSLDPDKDDSPGFDWDWPASGHRLSTDFRETAEHPRPVLGIKTGVTAKAAHVLGAVYLGRAVAVLLHDEDLLFLQVVEQTDVVRGNEELRVAGIGLSGAEPVENFADDIHVKITVDLVEGSGNTIL